MFRRIVIEEWHTTLAAVGFIITAGVFLTILVRTLRMKREQVDHMARLPLEDAPPPAKKD